MADAEDDDVLGEGTCDNGEHEQDDKEVDEDSFDGGDLEAGGGIIG